VSISDNNSFLAFRQIDFRRFIFSKFLLTLALQIQFVVLSWQVYEITHDPLSLGLLGLAEAVPAVGLALYGGYISDRRDRRGILLVVVSLQLFVSAALLTVSYYYTHGSALSSAMPFYVIMFFVGTLRSFYSPAQFPLMTQLVPREAYANSSAWNSTFWHVGVVAGSAGGGLLLSLIGKNYSYLIVLVLIFFSIVQLWRIPKQPIQGSIKTETMSQSIREGLRFVFKNQPVFGALTLDLIAVLFGGAIAMLPVFASEILHVGETGFGLLRAAPFAGSVLMALYMTRHPPMKNAGRKLLVCVAAFSLCMIVFALSRNFYFSLFILALSGAFDNVSVVVRSTILQYMCPDEMRGRVSSVSTMFISSSNELGAFESGFAAKLMGLVPSVIFGGVVAVASLGVAAKWLPELRNLNLKS
jgi:MFS family permease